MYTKATAQRVLFATLCAALASCSGVQPVAYTGMESSSYLAPNTKDDSAHIPYRYATQVNWANYSRIIIDPVQLYQGPDNQFGDMSGQDKDALAKYMQAQFSEKLRTRFAVVNDPAANTLRLKLTLTGAKTNTPFLSTFAHVDMGGNLYNGIQAIRGGEGAMSGSVLYAVEISDASTNRLLSAYVTKQYPGAMNFGASIGTLAASKTGIEKGADMLVAQLK